MLDVLWGRRRSVSAEKPSSRPRFRRGFEDFLSSSRGTFLFFGCCLEGVLFLLAAAGPPHCGAARSGTSFARSRCFRLRFDPTFTSLPTRVESRIDRFRRGLDAERPRHRETIFRVPSLFRTRNPRRLCVYCVCAYAVRCDFSFDPLKVRTFSRRTTIFFFFFSYVVVDSSDARETSAKNSRL